MPVRLVTAASFLAAALWAAAAAPAPPPAAIKLVACSPEAHSAGFHGKMKRIEGSERMWMRFTLLEKRTGGLEAVEAPGLGRWHRSKLGVGTFGYRQTVRGLQPGASYRMQVNYRWYSAERKLVARTRRTSVACRQFERLPNLTASIVAAKRTKVEGVLRYGVLLQNVGVAAARNVGVRLAVDGDVVDTATVDFLRAGQSRLLGFRGPACAASVTATVDPDGVLVESAEDDNVQDLPCADLPRG